MIPSLEFRYVLRQGLQGHEIWALQINLSEWARIAGVKPVVETGFFGSETLHLVRVYQRRRGLVVDGIAGLTTQKYLALDLLRPFQDLYSIPLGLMRGIVQGETGWAIGAVNWNSPGGVDAGWAQRRVYEPYTNDQKFYEAFNGNICFEDLAMSLRAEKDFFYNKLPEPIRTDRRAWELGLLDWNWPAAALRYAAGLTDWSYWDHWIGADGVERKQLILMSQPAHWVQAIGVEGVNTGHEWASHYINSKIKNITWWTH